MDASFRNTNPLILELRSIDAFSPKGEAKEQVLPLTSVIWSASDLICLWLFWSMAWSQLKVAPAALNCPFPISTDWGYGITLISTVLSFAASGRAESSSISMQVNLFMSLSF